MSQPVTIDVATLAETEALGRRLGAALFPDAVVALIGPLGAGKTHFVRAVAEGLGIANPRSVTSPTFVLVQEYPARLPIFHFDAYRLNGANEFAELGAGEYFCSKGVCLIEWADRVTEVLPEDRLTICIESLGENRRRFHFQATGVRHEGLIAVAPPSPVAGVSQKVEE